MHVSPFSIIVRAQARGPSEPSAAKSGHGRSSSSPTAPPPPPQIRASTAAGVRQLNRLSAPLQASAESPPSLQPAVHAVRLPAPKANRQASSSAKCTGDGRTGIRSAVIMFHAKRDLRQRLYTGQLRAGPATGATSGPTGIPSTLQSHEGRKHARVKSWAPRHGEAAASRASPRASVRSRRAGRETTSVGGYGHIAIKLKHHVDDPHPGPARNKPPPRFNRRAR